MGYESPKGLKVVRDKGQFAQEPAKPEKRRGIIPSRADDCWRRDWPDIAAEYGFNFCGCIFCSPHLWCSVCATENPARINRAFRDKKGNSDGKCEHHTSLLVSCWPALREQWREIAERLKHQQASAAGRSARLLPAPGGEQGVKP